MSLIFWDFSPSQKADTKGSLILTYFTQNHWLLPKSNTCPTPDLEAGDSGILVGLLCWVSSFLLLSMGDLVLHGPGSNIFLSLLNFLFIRVPTPQCDQTLNSFCCLTLLPLFSSTIVNYKNLGKTLELFIK